MKKQGNPLHAWLMKQPREVTRASLSRELDLHPSYVSDLMADNNTTMPSLPLAVQIERRTGGAVTAVDLHDFVMRNRKQAAISEAAA